ncbi:hypothetical protein [Polaromonas eurypsychrophila]|uniref:Uncharacterized protein n=1 Tax=Polaromonas eurypsychrophila TaxID=1614635 RepID=A0A916SQD3_9BURK|nr:hypothetical protein [Polaromonas eurypsychrophila]GGB11402.1 hypothetical protein GCM10011496_35400 [Polaromonas eurypsychrophila]
MNAKIFAFFLLFTNTAFAQPVVIQGEELKTYVVGEKGRKFTIADGETISFLPDGTFVNCNPKQDCDSGTYVIETSRVVRKYDSWKLNGSSLMPITFRKDGADEFFNVRMIASRNEEVSVMGQKTTYQFIALAERGREIYEADIKSVSARLNVSGGITTIRYGNGRVDAFDSSMSMMDFVSPARRGKLAGNQFHWKPSDLTPGKKQSIRTSMVSAFSCGVIQLDYSDVSLKEGHRKLLIKGKEVDVPVVEVSFDGRWAGTCGTGKDQQEIVYAPSLGLIIESTLLNYHPDSFLNSGQKVKLVSLD